VSAYRNLGNYGGKKGENEVGYYSCAEIDVHLKLHLDQANEISHHLHSSSLHKVARRAGDLDQASNIRPVVGGFLLSLTRNSRTLSQSRTSILLRHRPLLFCSSVLCSSSIDSDHPYGGGDLSI
jgi:hypothetical protein